MYNPFHNMDWGDPLNWPYIVAIFLTPFVLLACLAAIAFGGWFVGPLWVLFVLWLEPEEVEQHRNDLKSRSNRLP